MNRMIEAFAHTLAVGERALPGNYNVEYKIETHLSKVIGANTSGVKLKKVARCKLVDNNKGILLESFVRWLVMFGKRQKL